MQQRPYGNTDDTLSIIGFGGIVVKDSTPEEASQRVGNAIDHGVTYFDVAPSYGNAEACLGPALEPYRNDVFLACKTGKRDKAGALAELEQSLKYLRTDNFDVYQMHAMKSWEDFEQATGPGGAMEALIEAREKGQIRHIGFSAHSDTVALALMDQFDFDSILFPINWVNYLEVGWGADVVDKAEEKGMGCMALKGMARGRVEKGDPRPYDRCWYDPVDDRELADLAIRFTLSQPITAAVPPGDPKLFEMALEIGENFTPITESEIEHLKTQTKGVTPLATQDWIVEPR